MGAKKLELGPTGETVRENIAYLRENANLGFTEFSRRLERVGHSIPPLGLRRIENGERKITVDDLAAIACVLQCTPDYLLLPRSAADDPIETTGWGEMTVRELWSLLTLGRIAFTDLESGEYVRIFLHNDPDWLLVEDPELAQMTGRTIMSELSRKLKAPTEEDNRQ